ncbi:MAG: M20/M25/M40 family metallo-hydrolase [Acidobacteria bacterium]|nr:M20/M25/M40 family metallo-hydrolase [Acidobacteriota bacterium]
MASQFSGRVDRERVEDRLVRYVSTHSVNPALDGGRGEASLADVVEADLRALGFDPTREVVHPGGRDNVAVLLKGSTGAPVVMFHAHLDTVGLSGAATAEARVNNGLVFGRGACDTKGSLAAMVEAMALLAADDSRRASVLFVGGIDEEVGGTGARALVAAHPEIGLAVVGEPTGLEMAIAHKGVLRFEIATSGVAAHSSKPHLGVNAIHAMAKVLIALEEEYIPALGAVQHPLVGVGTFNVSAIEGGSGQNVVPATAVISVERRIVPGEDPDDLLAEFDVLLDGVRALGHRIERREFFLSTAALDTPPDHPVVKALGSAREAVLGEYGSPIGVTFGTDASFFDPAGIGCVIFGPGSIDQAHADEEWVGIEDTALAAEILAQTAVNLAG